MNRRSMAGRVYQQQIFKPKSISLNNPEERKLHYPIKGDTAFDPEEFGRKHLSPKHSAIHSIIFNEDYDVLIRQKHDMLRKPSLYQQFKKFDQNAEKQKIRDLNNYLNDHVIRQNKMNNHSNPFPPYNNFNSYPSMQPKENLRKGNLFRQGSMNQVLKPFSLPGIEHRSSMNRNRSSMVLAEKKKEDFDNDIKDFSLLSESNSNATFTKNLKDSPRQINPNYLNSIF